MTKSIVYIIRHREIGTCKTGFHKLSSNSGAGLSTPTCTNTCSYIPFLCFSGSFSSLFMAPKDYSLGELLEGISEGYYLKSFRGGQANIDGTFQVGIQEAYKIVKGEIGEPVRNASISGNTLETLVKVDAAGKDFKLWPGRCGKGQTAFICDGGPPIRVREVTVGGSA